MGMAGAPQLDGRVAIVTGGSRGIGLAIASMLLSRGAAVAISGVSESNLESARGRVTRELGPEAADRVEAVQADVRDPLQVAALVSRAVARFGRLDILVNNAGVGSFAEVAGQDPDDWRRTIDTNLTGVFYCCHEAIPHLRRAGGGWIVNISSLAGKNPFAGGAAYCASKAGLNAFSEALMQELRYDNIRVSYVLPGSVDTGFSGHVTPADWKLSPEDVAEVVSDLLSHHPRSLPSRVELRPSKPRK
jgi:NAD(P)-dependent dehydrogenase (short-subunit alcohol dehydrogenase family)